MSPKRSIGNQALCSMVHFAPLSSLNPCLCRSVEHSTYSYTVLRIGVGLGTRVALQVCLHRASRRRRRPIGDNQYPHPDPHTSPLQVEPDVRLRRISAPCRGTVVLASPTTYKPGSGPPPGIHGREEPAKLSLAFLSLRMTSTSSSVGCAPT